jgi:hypothetical protein
MMIGKLDLKGTWRLVSFEMQKSDGQVVYPLGKSAVGVLNYDVEGNMSVQLMRLDRQAFAANDQLKGTPEEVKSAFEGYVAYFGKYEVNEEKGTVTHRLKGSIFPNWVGSDQVRFFELSGDRLTLRAPPIQLGGTALTSLLIWDRMS